MLREAIEGDLDGLLSLYTCLHDDSIPDKTFKRLSNDELVNVNPHPIIEFLEYNHPGMYQRIKAIREAEGV